MSKLGKLSLFLSAVSLICLVLGRLAYGGWHPLLWIPLVFFLALFVFPIVKDGKLFLQFMTMKTTKRGLSMGSMILLMVVALGLLNFVAARKIKTWDFSVTQTNTLSDQSIKLMKSLDSELKITFFYKSGVEGTEENRRLFREMVKKYQDQSDKVVLDFVEVNERPDLAKEYGVNKGSGVVFLDYKGRRNRIEKVDEQEITGALVKASREKDKKVYFVTGHGEVDLDESREATGGNTLKQLLANNRYTVETLALNVAPKIPSDADAIAIVGPQQGFLDHELAALEGYLKAGGALFLVVDPKESNGLEKILAKIGIQPENNYVMNVVETMMGKGVNQGPTVGPTFSATSEITRVFGKNQITLFRFPQGLKKADPPPAGVSLDELVKTPEASMAFKDLTLNGDGPTGAFTLAIEAKGTFPGGDKGKEFHAVVVGNTAFLSNAMLYQNLNRDFLLNTFASLAKEENLISITPKEPQVTQMTLTDTKYSVFLWSFIVPLPLLLLAASIGLWARRRFA